MLNEKKENTRERLSVDDFVASGSLGSSKKISSEIFYLDEERKELEKKFLKEKIFLSLYIVFSVLSAFLLGVMVEKYTFLEANKSVVYYSKVK